MEEKKTFNEEVVNTLKREELELRKRMKIELEKGNYSMYKQLITAYSSIVELVKTFDWKLMYSEYSYEVDSSGTIQKQVAIWEQNGDGLIRNYKKWNIEMPVKGESN